MKTLQDCIAIVTGATRGAGRGIAEELGAAGATVFVTGRTTRSAPTDDHYRAMLAATELTTMPGSVEDAAEAVTAAGGRGIAVVCDHTDVDQVEALFARVERDHGRLDLLVNNAWGGHETFSATSWGAPFWEQPLEQWRSMFDAGVRNHLVASRCAAPRLVRQRRGLIVTTTFADQGRYLAGNLFYDLAKASMCRLAFGMGHELAPHGATSVALTPGFMRTELVLAHHGVDEDTWRDHPGLAASESPRFVGRAVVALAGDPDVARHNTATLEVAALARHYGFTDVDGRQPEAFRVA